MQVLAVAKTNIGLELESQVKVERAQAQNNLEQQTFIMKDPHVVLEQMEGAKKALQTEMESMRSELRVSKQLRAAAEINSDDCLFPQEGSNSNVGADTRMKEAPRKQKEKAKETLENSQTYHRLQLEDQRAESRKIAAALKKAEELLEIELLCFKQENKESREREENQTHGLSKGS
ncbi:hypothetical protein ABVT39_015552 [Epinephelus coioides]